MSVSSDTTDRGPSLLIKRNGRVVYSPTGDEVYEVKVLAGNHGPWLFVRRDGTVVFEQAGMESDEAAQALGRKYIETDREVRARARACEHQWPEAGRFGRTCTLCKAMQFNGRDRIILPRPESGSPRVIVDAQTSA